MMSNQSGMISIGDLERLSHIFNNAKRHRSVVADSDETEITEHVPDSISSQHKRVKKEKIEKKYLDDDPSFDSHDVIEDKTVYEPTTYYKGVPSAHRVKEDPEDILKQQRKEVLRRLGIHTAPPKPSPAEKYRYAFV